MQQQVHRPGEFKKPNKKHKGDVGSARAEKKGGRQATKVVARKAKRQMDKQQRRHQMAMHRKTKREEVLSQKRARGNDDAPPFLVAIVPLCRSVNSNDILDAIKSCPDTKIMDSSRVCHINALRLKQRFAFVKPAYGDLSAVLDAARVADCLLLSVSLEDSLSDYAEQVLSCLFVQGLPSVIICLQGLKSLPIKKQSDAKKDIAKQLEQKFPDAKIQGLDDPQDALLVLRSIGSQKLAKMPMREYRPHLIANEMIFEPQPDDATVGVLKVTGYLRGQSLSVDQAVHIPGFGDFQLLQIDAPSDPHRLNSRATTAEVTVLECADLTNRSPLDTLSQIQVNPMSEEQTWPTEEEMKEAEHRTKRREKKRKIKKVVAEGTSEYQAEWLDDFEEEDDDDEVEEEGDMDEVDSDDDNSEMEHNSLMAPASESASDEEGNAEKEDEDGDGNDDAMSIAASEYDKKVHFADDVDEQKIYKEARSEAMFPDEIDTPADVPAKLRFQKYRGLASFRTSPWIPHEDEWPSDYQRIAEFKNFNSARKAVLNSLKKPDNCRECRPGRYVTIHIDKVPSDVINEYSHQHPLVIFGLLHSEHCISVVNMVIQRHRNCDDIFKSKEPMIFHVGYRRFTASPVYSQHTVGNKYKMERFLNSEETPVVATVYAPIIYPPASVLMFKKLPNGEERLVASGRVLSVDPERLILKRIVLSGHPFKINGKMAVVRYMFFNRDDILWYKPVELVTKSGRRGNILEPLGTHGHMKCLFNRKLNASDVVLMKLYKRVFPKLTYNARVPLLCSSHDDNVASENGEDDLMEIFG